MAAAEILLDEARGQSEYSLAALRTHLSARVGRNTAICEAKLADSYYGTTSIAINQRKYSSGHHVAGACYIFWKQVL